MEQGKGNDNRELSDQLLGILEAVKAGKLVWIRMTLRHWMLKDPWGKLNDTRPPLCCFGTIDAESLKEFKAVKAKILLDLAALSVLAMYD